MTYKILTYSTALLAVFAMTPQVQAETVKTTKIIEAKEMPDMTKTDFSVFDVNNDGQFSKEEVGEKLFYVFDRDGNEVIDNLEWDHKSMMTIIPMEEHNYKFIDKNEDGYVDQSQYTYKEFFQTSGLMKFDKNYNGLSASEFIETSFQVLDDNDNNLIDIEEWEEAYSKATSPENAQQENYNN